MCKQSLHFEVFSRAKTYLVVQMVIHCIYYMLTSPVVDVTRDVSGTHHTVS